MSDQMQRFYGRAGKIPKDAEARSTRSRSYASLELLASVFTVVGWAVAILGTVFVFIQAIEMSDSGNKLAAASTILSLIVVAVLTVTYLAVGQLIRLLVDVQDNSYRVAIAVEDIDTTLDEIQQSLDRRAETT